MDVKRHLGRLLYFRPCWPILLGTVSDNSFQPLCRREDALAILETLRKNGHVAYFAGGCVRDMLLGLESNDYDVATDAPPERVRQIFPHSQAVGAAFGVILVHQGQSVIEVATFRSDLHYADGRRPEGVRFATPEEDARRRDFTINGLFLDPLTGQVIDFVDGQTDLKNRVLRAIGDPEHRFAEDHLRLLRAVRFAARFSLEIESATATAIRRNASALIRISPERIADELRMMLSPPTRVCVWRMLWEFKLVEIIFRDLNERTTDNSAREVLFPRLANQVSIDFGLALAGLVLDYRLYTGVPQPVLVLLDEGQTKRSVRACRKDLKISNDEAEMMSDCLHLDFLLGSEPPSVAVMKRFLAGRNASQARMMLNTVAEMCQSLCRRVDWLNGQFEEFLKTDFAPLPLISGDDLLAAGLSAGPLFKYILRHVYDAQLEGKISAREQAMAMATELANKK
jgi:poly(A) polymerase